jgi:ribose transport system substrate-binding protein
MKELTNAMKALALCGATVALVTGCGSASSSDGGSGGGGAQTAAPTADAASEVSQLQVQKVNVDMTKYCGKKPTKVGILDGVGGYAWREETQYLVTQLAKKCPNVTDVLYFSANGDPQKYNSEVASWAAQGVNVIVTVPDFGQASVPAFRSAERAGVKIATHNSIAGNAKVPTDITAAVEPDFAKGAEQWVEFIAKTKGDDAKILLLGGPPGNGFDPPAMAAVKAAIAKVAPNMQLLDQNPVVTNWDAAKTQQVAAGLISKYPDLDGIIMTYIATAPSVIKAYESAGKPVPALAGISSSNQLVCEAKEANDKKPGSLPLYTLDGSGNASAVALAKAMAAYQGIDAPELGPTDAPTLSNYATWVDTSKDEIPDCDPSLPPGADLSHALTREEVAQVTK